MSTRCEAGLATDCARLVPGSTCSLLGGRPDPTEVVRPGIDAQVPAAAFSTKSGVASKKWVGGGGRKRTAAVGVEGG